MKRLALRSALSARAADGQIKVVGTFDVWDTPRTKNATALLEAMGVSGKVLLLAEDHERVAIKSFRNIQGVIASNLGQANTYDVLWAETVIMSKGTLDLGQSVPRGTEEHAEEVASRESRVVSNTEEVKSQEFEEVLSPQSSVISKETEALAEDSGLKADDSADYERSEAESS
jgi:hypothetical protein